MFRDGQLDQILGTNPRPNKFTIGMGKLIRAAREEVGYSQRELAELIYRRQAALSDMENGKMEPDASTLLLFSVVLQKPISFFYPKPWKPELLKGELSEYQLELLLQVDKLTDEDVMRLIVQIKALVELQTRKTG